MKVKIFLSKHLYMDKDIILAYPRSGSHLFRFMFEILSEQGTVDFTGNCIYTHDFTDVVDFNVNPEDKTWNKHLVALDHHDIDNLIVLYENLRGSNNTTNNVYETNRWYVTI